MLSAKMAAILSRGRWANWISVSVHLSVYLYVSQQCLHIDTFHGLGLNSYLIWCMKLIIHSCNAAKNNK